MQLIKEKEAIEQYLIIDERESIYGGCAFDNLNELHKIISHVLLNKHPELFL